MAVPLAEAQNFSGTLQSSFCSWSVCIEQFNALSTKLYLTHLKTQFVPRSKHSVSVLKTDKLMLYREIIGLCSEIHTKHINALWAEQRISEC